MNCNDVRDLIRQVAAEELPSDQRHLAMDHIENCADCRAALRGAEALFELRQREVPEPQPALFDEIVDKVVEAPQSNTRFWQGAGFGAIAASILTIALFFGFDGPEPRDPGVEFAVSVDEPRLMSLAFETDRDLDGATISIDLSGSVEIDGYAGRRHIEWLEDLDAGVNRLSLPVIANGIGGGQMVVRLRHPESNQEFVISMPVDS